MTDKKYTPEELEKMADSMLKESASGKPGKGAADHPRKAEGAVCQGQKEG